MALRQENQLLRKADATLNVIPSLPSSRCTQAAHVNCGQISQVSLDFAFDCFLEYPLKKSHLTEGVVSVSGFSFSELKEIQSGPRASWREVTEKAANFSLHLVPHVYSCWHLSPYQPLCRARPALLCGNPNVSSLSELCIFVFANQLSLSEGRGAC